MSDEQNAGNSIIVAVEGAVVNVIEAGASGGLVAAETAAISEVAKAAGKVAEIVNSRVAERRQRQKPLNLPRLLHRKVGLTS